MTGDYNIIISGPDMGASGQPNRFFQSAPRTIARNGGSEPLGCGEPEANHFLIWLAIAH